MSCEFCSHQTPSLDDLGVITKVDKGDMFSLTQKMPEDIEQALSDFGTRTFSRFSPVNIVIAGMGGSAISGDIANSLLRDELSIPLIVMRDYNLPSFIKRTTLFFAVSYSGNTEETLSAYNEAKAKNARCVVISSGGKLKEIAGDDVYISLPSGMPPRAAFPFIFVPLVRSLEAMEIVKKRNDWQEAIELLRELREEYSPLTPTPENNAKKLAYSLKGKLPLIYASSPLLYGVALRWKTQINENAKAHAYVDYFPELHHNEIMAWERNDKVANFAVVLLRDKGENDRIKKRIEITKELIGDKTEIYEVWTRGEGKLARIFSLIYFGDMLSLYLAVLYGVDPQEIDFINHIKNKLGKFPTS
ncbi:bifunctional phosphoglucose/phosphomannose isomerase [bacterium]|nr:bifunctional phosphoglucose/phosphomannose isomerase [bacterium]